MYVNKNTLYKAQNTITEYLDLVWQTDASEFGNMYIYCQQLITSDNEIEIMLSPILFITEKTSDILKDLKVRGFNVRDGQFFSVSLITKKDDGTIEFTFS